MSVYQSDPDREPDSEFEPGTVQHLVVGNAGRVLDPRRTPVTIIQLDVDTGFMVLRVDAFEDVGALWHIPFEDVGHYQFALGCERATGEAIDEFREAIERFDRPLVIEADPRDRRTTEERIGAQAAEAEDWLDGHSRFLASGRALPDPATRRGDVTLAADLASFMQDRGLWEMEETFARQYVRHPSAGEIVKGHRIVIAELGLAPFAGTIVRDPATFEAPWSRPSRAAHVCARLGFMRALFGRLGLKQVLLWRGISTPGPLQADRRPTLVSASFSETVAGSHLEGLSRQSTRLLVRRLVPIRRVFMTYLETGSMNEHYLEAEAVLLAEPGDEVGGTS